MLKELTTIRNIFIPVIVLAVCCDAWANGFRTTFIYPHMAVGLWLMAIVLAVSGPLLSYYSDGDWVVTTVSLLCATTSLALSISSGLSGLAQVRDEVSQQYTNRISIQKELDSELTDEKIEECRQNLGVCSPHDMSYRRQELRDQLRNEFYPSDGKISKPKQILSWCILVVLGLVPLITVAATRILANSEQKLGVREPKRAVSGSHARNQPEKKPAARNQNRAENQEFPRASREGTSSKLG